MLRFVVALLPAVALATQTGSTTSTTPSPESVLLHLPASADEVIGQQKIDTTFSCAHRPLGFYADIANDCKIYHVCNPALLNDGQHVVLQYSFYCPIGQVFDQKARLCVPKSSIPCNLSESFYKEQGSVVRQAHSVATDAVEVPVSNQLNVVEAAPAQVVQVAPAQVQDAAPAQVVETIPVQSLNLVPSQATQTVEAVEVKPVPAAPAEVVPQAVHESATVGTAPAAPQPPTHTVQPVQETQPNGFHYQDNVPTHFIRHFPETSFHPRVGVPASAKVLRLG